MLLKFVVIFENYMKEILNINICKVNVNIISLYSLSDNVIYLSLAQGSCAEAASSRKNRSNNMSTL